MTWKDTCGRNALAALVLVATWLGFVQPQAPAQTPAGTAFTYQGRLAEDGSPANGQYDLKFQLYDTSAGGNQVGADVLVDDLHVTGGLFTAALDFGSGPFTGQALWLQVAVRPGGSSDEYTPLSPRQALTATPYALHTRGIFVDETGNVGIGTNTPEAPLEVAMDGPGGHAVELNQRREDNEIHINLRNNNGFWHISGPRSFEPSHQLGFFWNDNADFHHVMSLQSNGHVGIGTMSPQAPLEIASVAGADNVSLLVAGLGRFGNGIQVDQNIHGGFNNDLSLISTLPNEANASSIRFATSDGSGQAERMRIAPDGHVGIGTGAPDSPLTVAGTIESTSGGFRFPDGSVQSTAAGSGLWFPVGSDIFYTAGSVGIGVDDGFVAIGDTVVTKPFSLPSARSRVACAYSPATAKIYLLGGWQTSGDDALSQILEYDPSDGSLIAKTAQLPTGRYAMGCAVDPVTGRIFLFGGWDANGLFGDILEYDPLTGMLNTDAGDLAVPRAGIACAASRVTGKLYCFGGSDYADAGFYSAILEYNPASRSYSVMDASLPTARSHMACAEDPNTGKIYCFGGNEAGATLDQVLEYDPESPTTDPVIKSARMPSPRSRLACAADWGTGKIYCFGGDGGDEVGVSQVLEYDPRTDTLRVLDAVLPAMRTRIACAAVPGTGRICCFGGDTSRTPVNSILEYATPAQRLLQVGDPGDGTGAIANSWSVFSSREFKRDMAPLGLAEYDEILSKLKATDAVRFSYVSDPLRTPHLGVIAENAPAEILSPGGKGVSLADYSTFLMAAIKAQQALIEEKEGQLAALQEQMAETQKRLANLEAVVGQLEQRPQGGGR